MKKLQITGATGFIGRHVTANALACGYQVEVISRDDAIASHPQWRGRSGISFQTVTDLSAATLDPQAKLIHLAWPNVGSYKDISLLTQTLPEQITFLDRAISQGVSDVTVAGTCLEYGLSGGMCHEDSPCAPSTLYGLSKLMLLQFLQFQAQQHRALRYRWLRYFYVYGPGQRAKSLFGQLQSAIERGDSEFPMSPGDQQRDFISIETLARYTVMIAGQDEVTGIINVGSGVPTTVLQQVEKLRGNASIKLKTGVYPYPDYEPHIFYADTKKLSSIKELKLDQA